MPSRVLVTGASGFVGAAVLTELSARGYSVNALVNRHKPESTPASVAMVQGSLFDPSALDAALHECDAAIHLVGIIMERPAKGITFRRIHVEGTQNVVDAIKRAGVRRYIHMSALGARIDAISEYHKSKFAAEEYVGASGLDWTIFRPSLIHGPRGEFMQMEAKWARRHAPPFLFMPYFGDGWLGQRGAGRLQPVFVDDVARAFVDALENPRTIGKTYSLGGTEQLTWPELHQTISRNLLGNVRLTLPIPVWLGKFYAAIGLARLLGFNRDQVIMSQEDNTCDLTQFLNDFGWWPRGFEASLKSYAKEL